MDQTKSATLLQRTGHLTLTIWPCKNGAAQEAGKHWPNLQLHVWDQKTWTQLLNNISIKSYRLWLFVFTLWAIYRGFLQISTGFPKVYESLVCKKGAIHHGHPKEGSESGHHCSECFGEAQVFTWVFGMLSSLTSCTQMKSIHLWQLDQKKPCTCVLI